MALRVLRFLTSVNAANCYICWCETGRKGALVDPAEFTEKMKDAITDKGIRLQAILLTHGHYDHDGAVEEVRREHNIQVFANRGYPGGRRVGDGEVLELGNERIRVAAIPGHTPDSLAFIGEGLVFVGDALFAAAVGGTTDRSRFEEETGHVRGKILSLPECTILYPGHGPATTVAIEKVFNPFL